MVARQVVPPGRTEIWGNSGFPADNPQETVMQADAIVKAVARRPRSG
jgi:hypothetical protein